VPVLTYGADVWRPSPAVAVKLEAVQMKVGRALLGVSKNVANEAVLGELGLRRLAARRDTLVMRFFWRLVHMDKSRTVSRLFRVLREGWLGGARLAGGWCDSTAEVMQKYGLGHYWQSGNLPSKKQAWHRVVDKAVREVEDAEWQAALATKSTLVRYAAMVESEGHVPSAGPEAYLRESGIFQAVGVTRLRVGAHCLRVSQGRHRRGGMNTPLLARTCECCGGWEVEDEPHFVFDCPALSGAREAMMRRVRACVLAAPQGEGGGAAGWAWFEAQSREVRMQALLGSPGLPLLWSDALRRGVAAAAAAGVERLFERRKRVLYGAHAF
jgi:hypothetical protein